MADRFGTAPAYFVALLQEEWFSIFDHICMCPKGSTDSSTKVLGFCLHTVQGTLRALRGTEAVPFLQPWELLSMAWRGRWPWRSSKGRSKSVSVHQAAMTAMTAMSQ